MSSLRDNNVVHFVHDNVVAIVLSAAAGWVISMIIYRLVFHPLAAYPGPFLARISTAWQFYQDVLLGGRMSYTLRDLHAVYGPIIRTAPNTLHIADAEFHVK